MPAHDQSKDPTYGVFYDHAELQHDGSYKDVVLVEIFIKGNTNTTNSVKVFDNDGNPIKVNGMTYMERYPKAWAKYSNDTSYQAEGLGLENLRGLGPGARKNLEAEGIETIEDLANLTDAVVLGNSGRIELRKKARAYLAAMRPEEEARKLEEAEREKAELLERIAALESKIDDAKPKGRKKAAA